MIKKPSKLAGLFCLHFTTLYNIHLDTLLKRAQYQGVQEVILATNFTSEGEATAHYIGQMLKSRGVKVSRIARGLPMGGEIEYVDSGTLSTALIERKALV